MSVTEIKPDELTAALDAIRKRYRNCGNSPDTRRNLETWIDSANDVPRLLAVLGEVLGFHEPEESRHGLVCGYCTDAYGEPAEWPCETYQTISRVLLAG